MRQQADIGHTQDRATPVSGAVIPPHSLDAENAFRRRYKKTRLTHGQAFQSIKHRCITPMSPEMSPWNDNPFNRGQPNACPARVNPERTRLSQLPPLLTRMPCTLLSRGSTAPMTAMTHLLHIQVTMWFFFYTHQSSFTVDLVEYNCDEQFMMASKARLFGNDKALSVILASDDPREKTRLWR